MHINSQESKASFLNLFSLEYYLNVLRGQKRFRVFLIAFIFSIIFSIQASVDIVKDLYPLTRDIEKKASTFVNDYYPEELEVNIKKGKASSNVSEPYYITLPKEIIEDPTSFGKKESNSTSKVRILAIDTKGTAEDFESYQSMALLTQTNLVYYKDGGISIQSLRDVEDLTINKSKVSSEIGKISKQYHVQGIVNAFLIALIPLIVLGIFLVTLFTFLLLSVGVWIMLKINQLNFPFKKIYLYTASIAIIPTVIWNVLSIIPALNMPTLYLGFITDIVVLVIAYFGILKLKKQPVNVSSQV